MNLQQIKTAVVSGKVVHWANDGYTVICDKLGQWLIKHYSGNCVGLYGCDNKLNGLESEFYVKED